VAQQLAGLGIAQLLSLSIDIELIPHLDTVIKTPVEVDLPILDAQHHRLADLGAQVSPGREGRHDLVDQVGHQAIDGLAGDAAHEVLGAELQLIQDLELLQLLTGLTPQG